MPTGHNLRISDFVIFVGIVLIFEMQQAAAEKTTTWSQSIKVQDTHPICKGLPEFIC